MEEFTLVSGGSVYVNALLVESVSNGPGTPSKPQAAIQLASGAIHFVEGVYTKIATRISERVSRSHG